MKNVSSFLITGLFVVLFAPFTQGAQYYILDTMGENVAPEDQRAVTTLVRNAVNGMIHDYVVDDEAAADYSLQPRLMKLGESYILTVEKLHGGTVLFSGQARANVLEELDRAALRATTVAVNERGGREASRIAREKGAPLTTRQGTTIAAPPPPPVAVAAPAPEPVTTAGGGVTTTSDWQRLHPFQPGMNHWTLGFGPFLSRRLDSDNLMYNVLIGHMWDVHPKVSVKAQGEFSTASGDEQANFYNFSTGANYYFLVGPTGGAPYIMADIGYGFAESVNDLRAAGFSFGTGVGYQFFRLAETSLELQLRFAVITDDAEDGAYPTILGTRLAVNF